MIYPLKMVIVHSFLYVYQRVTHTWPKLRSISLACLLHQSLCLLLFLHPLFDALGVDKHPQSCKSFGQIINKALHYLCIYIYIHICIHILYIYIYIYACVCVCGLWLMMFYSVLYDDSISRPGFIWILSCLSPDGSCFQRAGGCDLGIGQGGDQLLIIQDVSFGIGQQLQDFVLHGARFVARNGTARNHHRTIIKQWQNDEIKVLPSSRIRIDVKVLPQEPRTKSSRIAVSSRQSSISFNCALLWALSMIKFCRFFSTSGSSCYESHHTLW